MHTHPLTVAAVNAFLISPWKPILILVVFLPWAWLVSSRLDKDARYFHLNARIWNSLHMGAGIAALVVMLIVPIIYAGWPIGVLVLLTPVLIYWRVRNQSVPAENRFYLTSESLSTHIQARRQKRAAKAAVIQFIDADGNPHDLPLKDDPEFPLHMMVEDLVATAIDARAGRIELAVGPNGVAVSQTVDGVRYKREPLAPEQALQLIGYVKRYAGLDVEDQRRQQTGEFSIHGPGGKSLLSVITAGSSNSQVLRIEIDLAERVSRPFDGLGLLPSQIEALRVLEEPHERHGIVLIGAPLGHGLTTTLYSFIGRHDAYTANIKTLEREVHRHLDGIDHIQWDPTNPDVDFGTQLQSMLRRDPDIMMIGFVKDHETARITAEPGMGGPLLYIAQRSPTIAEQIQEWVKIVGSVKQATRALRAVTNQRLLRSLCPNCRQAYQPPAEQLKKLNLPAEKVSQLFRASGKVQVKNKIETCPVCKGTGYLGQVGAFEVMIADAQAQKMLANGDLKAAFAHARRNKMVYLQEAALSKVVSGETTIEELIRVMAPGRGERGGSEPQKQPETNAVPTS